MMIAFTKMQALGNDFVVIDAVSQAINFSADFIRCIADRHYGVGCDQVLILTRSTQASADFGYRIFNADGSEVSQCGNGARCMGLFIQYKKLCDKTHFLLETRTDILKITCEEKGQFTVDIAHPLFFAADIPYLPACSLPSDIVLTGVVNVGNPHAVIAVDHIILSDVSRIGALLQAHPAFPERVNVGFMRVVSSTEIELCVYERGVGVTQACGSGACAAVAIGRQQGLLEASVFVRQPGGICRFFGRHLITKFN